MKNKKSYKSEQIFFFRSERNKLKNHYNNPTKFFVGIVDEISYSDINIHRFIGVVDDAGNRLNVTAKNIHDFEKGKTGRLVISWDTIYDTSYYVRESALTDEEKYLISRGV